ENVMSFICPSAARPVGAARIADEPIVTDASMRVMNVRPVATPHPKGKRIKSSDWAEKVVMAL
ncbi:MAG TPA: hypothetical protein VER79_02605, partial [Candidatus Limnocylindrales bacterium]|nr:hypothetical protein [Candidatus Limnocylindrales bacterium]